MVTTKVGRWRSANLKFTPVLKCRSFNQDGWVIAKKVVPLARKKDRSVEPITGSRYFVMDSDSEDESTSCGGSSTDETVDDFGVASHYVLGCVWGIRGRG